MLWLDKLFLFVATAAAQQLSHAGDRMTISGWHIQSSSNVSAEVSTFSQPGSDVSTWYRAPSRSSVVAGLLYSDVFSDEHLFYSDNMEYVDKAPFEVPWLYREQVDISPVAGQHYFLVTHGITSRADIWINGHLVVSKDVQVGSYGGQTYEVTPLLANGSNYLLVQAYPTNYLRDFAMGFVDWNPYPMDNGTGCWRDVEILQTGPISISAPRVHTNFENTWQKNVAVTAYADITNNENTPLTAEVRAVVVPPESSQSDSYVISNTVTLRPRQQQTVALTTLISDAKIWWPARWGEQPLYRVTVDVSVDNTTSDISESRSFGIRKVSSYLNGWDDTAFLINGQPFLVQGAGYSSDVFYRFDKDRARDQLGLVLGMGLNTIRLEGKQEHPELYQLADEMGIMVMAGWECCDKWEGWSYNDEADGVKWTDPDYQTANVSMLHETMWMQTHPSFLAFLVGSDYWPDDRATQIYVDALERYQWTNPVIASAAKRGYPELLGPSGMKMLGPYDWVPPNYWFANGSLLGAAFGFGSELGAGVGTPEIESLTKFLSQDDLEDLWKNPDKNLYHMSTAVSSFSNRTVYNNGLFNRYGPPTSLEDYLLKAQVMDYEATRAQFEAYTARRGAERPATGLIYWMLNSAWPNLHWQLFDYYLAAAGAFYGTKIATRPEHVVYDPESGNIYLINDLLESNENRSVAVDLINLNGTALEHQEIEAVTFLNSAQYVGSLSSIDNLTDVTFLRLVLTDSNDTVLSRNVYWLPAENDVLDWNDSSDSSWYTTPVTQWADLTSLFDLPSVTVNATMSNTSNDDGQGAASLTLANSADVPAFFIRLKLVDEDGDEILPAYWSENYVTLFPHETLELDATWNGTATARTVVVSGVNSAPLNVTINV